MPSKLENMSPIRSTPIIILGCGLSGLSLARTLAGRSIPTILYDRSPAPTTTPRHGYGLSIDAASTWKLLEAWKLGNGLLVTSNAPEDVQDQLRKVVKDSSSKVRIHRARLEEALSRGLDVSWGKRVIEIKTKSSDTKIRVKFEDGEEISAGMVVAADGIHSVTRRCLLSDTEASVLPWVVFRGKRKISRERWEGLERNMLANLQEAAFVTSAGQRLEVKIDDWANGDEIEISYTYSRAARTSSADPLHRPDRGLDDAKVIPDELYQELSALKDTPAGFRAIFSPELVRQDKLLHWLMRTQEAPDTKTCGKLAGEGVLFIGEAARAKPILGGYGAETAIRDGVALGDIIAASYGEQDCLQAIQEWYDSQQWADGLDVERSHEVLEAMHTASTGESGNLKL